MKMIRSCLILAVLAAAVASVPPARAEERANVPDRYKWNTADLYASEAAWQSAREDLAKRTPDIAKHQGRLGESAATFAAALATLMDLDRGLTQLQVYASMRKDEDTRVGKPREMLQTAEQMYVQFRAAASYVQPEILALGAGKVHDFLGAEPKLAEYRPFLEDILRRAPHTLSPEEEKIAAQAGTLTGAGSSTYSILTGADLPYPEITLSTGEKAKLDNAGYTRYRALPDREDRMKVFRTFWATYRDYERTLGTTLYSQVQAHIFNKDVHKFDSCLEAALFGPNVPPAVYRQLLADVHANLPTLHRYLRLRQRMMGVDTLRYEDLYAPVVKKVEMKFTPEQAMDLTLKAAAPLGKDYVETLRRGFDSRWVDFVPTTGKRSGAYSTGAYGVHPYQLQNFTGLYDEVSTLAHESGHSMHTWLSDQHQPYATHDYVTFVAEVASTLNENLLLHHMLGRTTDRDARLFLLGSYLEGMRTTLFRQTMFAEFELKIHELAEGGESLTGENLSALYLDLLKQYYGDAQGVCRIADLYGVEWTYIPHFYYNFYVYQYATSIVASTSIAKGIRAEAEAKKPSTRARDAFLAMLSSGSSKYPIDLLKGAGVDMTTSAPFTAAIQEMNGIMDEMEKLLKQ